MNSSEPKYMSEYVELKTSLEHIRTKIENLEITVREIHRSFAELNAEVNKNRSEIAGIKASAAVVGGLAGSLFALFSRLFFSCKP